MKQFGLALNSYHDARQTFPPGGVSKIGDPGKIYCSPHAMLLPYFEEAGLDAIYDKSKDWQHQDPRVAARVIPVFVCPSSSGDNPVFDPLLINIFVTAVMNGYQGLGATNYAFCKGVTDAWCFPAFTPPGTTINYPPYISERGMFDFNWAMTIPKVTDGTSRTIALGDAASGANWPVIDTCSTGVGQNDESVRTHAAGLDSSGTLRWHTRLGLPQSPRSRRSPRPDCTWAATWLARWSRSTGTRLPKDAPII